jgi:hypothetical protein
MKTIAINLLILFTLKYFDYPKDKEEYLATDRTSVEY